MTNPRKEQTLPQLFNAAIILSIVFIAPPAPLQAQFRLFGSSVETVTTKEVAEMLAEHQTLVKRARAAGEETPKADFVLVDVRSAEETKVSMLPGAITLQDFEANRDTYRQRTVIPYCTIGGRSDEYSRLLIKQGFTVKNYKGSILDWIKHKLPLVDPDGQSTRRVHTYDKRYKVPEGYEQVLR